MRALGLVLLIACAPREGATPVVAPAPAIATAAAPAPAPVPSVAPTGTTLRDRARDADHMLLLDERLAFDEAVIVRFGAVRFAADGPAVGDDAAPSTWHRVKVVNASDAARLRVVLSFANVSMLLWIDQADVAPQLVRPATLRPSAGAVLDDDDGRIELGPGELVEITARADGWSAVKTYDGISGWVPDTELGPVFREQPFPSQGTDTWLRAGAALHVRPRGKPLHRPGVSPDVAPADRQRAEVRLLRSEAQWLEVEYIEGCRPTVRVRGWARRRDTEVVGPIPGGFGCGRGAIGLVSKLGAFASAPKQRVAAGTELVDEAGRLVGRVTADVELPRADDGSLRVPSPWGPLPVRIAVP